MTYDETAYLKRVSLLSRPARVAWASGAAELLWPTATRLRADILNSSDTELLRTELDNAWSFAEGKTPNAGGAAMAEQMIPDDEVEGFDLQHGLLQRVAASVAYATRCSTSGEAQDGVWAWRQVEEIVDVARQDRADRHEPDRSGLPDVGVIIPEYLSMLGNGQIETFRMALRTRAAPLSRALVPD